MKGLKPDCYPDLNLDPKLCFQAWFQLNTSITCDSLCLGWVYLFILCGLQVRLKSPAAALTLIADVLARIANTDRGLALFLYEMNVVVAHTERWDGAIEFRLKTLGLCVSFILMNKLHLFWLGKKTFISSCVCRTNPLHSESIRPEDAGVSVTAVIFYIFDLLKSYYSKI